jgi:hypothetical protein
LRRNHHGAPRCGGAVGQQLPHFHRADASVAGCVDQFSGFQSGFAQAAASAVSAFVQHQIALL